MSDPRTRLVAAGYDAMADTWEEWSSQRHRRPAPRLARAAARACCRRARASSSSAAATARRETRELAQRFQLTGVDLSEEQLRRARERVPGATFVHGDLTTIEFDAGSLDAVARSTSLNHVPRELLPGLFARIHGWLRPGGHLLATLGASDLAGLAGRVARRADVLLGLSRRRRTAARSATRASSSCTTRS